MQDLCSRLRLDDCKVHHVLHVVLRFLYRDLERHPHWRFGWYPLTSWVSSLPADKQACVRAQLATVLQPEGVHSVAQLVDKRRRAAALLVYWRREKLIYFETPLLDVSDDAQIEEVRS